MVIMKQERDGKANCRFNRLGPGGRVSGMAVRYESIGRLNLVLA